MIEHFNLYDEFLGVMESVKSMSEPLFAQDLSPHLRLYRQREWIQIAGYSGSQVHEFDDGWIAEVEHEIDVAAGVYRYPNPRWRGQILVRPIDEIAYHTLRPEAFVQDLRELMGLKAPHQHTTKIVDLLWEVGHLALLGAPDVRVFLARTGQGRACATIQRWLDDEVDPGRAFVIVFNPVPAGALGKHLMGCLADYFDLQAQPNQFRIDKLHRILMRHAQSHAIATPIEILDGNSLKLTHFEAPIDLTAAQARIVAQCWGAEHKPAPVVTWAETNSKAKTGYVSFDDAFGEKHKRELIFELVTRGRYRLRRFKTVKKP